MRAFAVRNKLIHALLSLTKEHELSDVWQRNRFANLSHGISKVRKDL